MMPEYLANHYLESSLNIDHLQQCKILYLNSVQNIRNSAEGFEGIRECRDA